MSQTAEKIEYTDYTVMYEPWKRQIEQDLGLPVGARTVHQLSVTGEPYVAIMSLGVKEEGAEIDGVVFSREKAFQLFRRAVAEYSYRLTGDNDTGWSLYWRTPPVCDTESIKAFSQTRKGAKWEEREVYNFYARLLVSNKPVIGDPHE